MDNNAALPSQKPTASEPFYTIILSPGVVRYLVFSVFLKASVEDVIEALTLLSPTPTIKSPTSYYQLNFSEANALVVSESWEDRLRIHHRIGGLLFSDKCFSWPDYQTFHIHLRLGKNLSFDEFFEAWIPVSDVDLVESYENSAEHITVAEKHGLAIFKKTDFVNDRLIVVSQAAERERKEAQALEEKIQRNLERQTQQENLEVLRRSAFATFVYFMEDLRNGHFKIGQSTTPGRRERTLQSEVPKVILRFAIPGEKNHESLLHAHFASKNIRGEWFSLTPDDLLEAVFFLKENGDLTRARVDYEWLGKLCLETSRKSKI